MYHIFFPFPLPLSNPPNRLPSPDIFLINPLTVPFRSSKLDTRLSYPPPTQKEARFEVVARGSLNWGRKGVRP